MTVRKQCGPAVYTLRPVERANLRRVLTVGKEDGTMLIRLFSPVASSCFRLRVSRLLVFRLRSLGGVDGPSNERRKVVEG